MVDDFIRRQTPGCHHQLRRLHQNAYGCEVNHYAAFKGNALGPQAQAAKRPAPAWCMSPCMFSGRENGGIARTEATIPGPISATAPPSYGRKLLNDTRLIPCCKLIQLVWLMRYI